MTDTGETLSPSLLSTKAPCMSPKGFIDRRETDPGSPEKRMSRGEGLGKTGPEKWMRKNPWQEPLISALSPQPVHPRWMMCMEKTQAFFEPTLATLFIQETFRPSTQSAVREGSSSADVPPTPSHPTHLLHFALLAGFRDQRTRQFRESREGHATPPECTV